MGCNGAPQGTVCAVAINDRISAALGSLDTTRCPSTKDMPKTTNGLANNAGLEANTIVQYVQA